MADLADSEEQRLPPLTDSLPNMIHPRGRPWLNLQSAAGTVSAAVMNTSLQASHPGTVSIKSHIG